MAAETSTDLQVRRLIKSVASGALAMLPGQAEVRLQSRRELTAYRRQYGSKASPRPHDLPGELILSVTSYPPRFITLDRTLESLLDQTVRPDRIILWIAHNDEAALPRQTRRLIDAGVELRLVPDTKSFKKLIYAVEQWPRGFILTADDDTFYVPTWLEQLVSGFDPSNPAITCHRAHRFPEPKDGKLPPYLEWESDVRDEAARRPSTNLMATGLGGILYFPGSLHPDVVNRSLFEELCPRADDLWFYWCARRAGSLYKKVGERFPNLHWTGSQAGRLFDENATANDDYVERLLNAYGNPLSMPNSGTD